MCWAPRAAVSLIHDQCAQPGGIRIDGAAPAPERDLLMLNKPFATPSSQLDKTWPPRLVPGLNVEHSNWAAAPAWPTRCIAAPARNDLTERTCQRHQHSPCVIGRSDWYARQHLRTASRLLTDGVIVDADHISGESVFAPDEVVG